MHLAIHLLILILQILFRLFDRREVFVVWTHDLGNPESLLLIDRITVAIQRPERINRLPIYGAESLQSFLSADDTNISAVTINIRCLRVVDYLSIFLHGRHRFFFAVQPFADEVVSFGHYLQLIRELGILLLQNLDIP